MILISRGKVEDIENDVNEHNNDEYQECRGKNQKKCPEYIEAAGFRLPYEMECKNFLYTNLELTASDDGSRGTELWPLHLL